MYKWFVGLLVCLLFVSGCAKTVTSIVTYGDQMVVEVTLRGTMEVNANRYFMVLASDPSFKTPLPPPDNISYEFLEPGTTPMLGAIADYYTNYYSTWAGYIMVEPGGFFSVAGPFVSGVVATRESFSSLGEITSKITYNFRLSRIFGGTIPSTIYFDVVSVPWPTDQPKLAADHLTSTNAYISIVAGSTVPVSDEENTSLDPATDILKCTVSIQ
jgi:hypothetical protein